MMGLVVCSCSRFGHPSDRRCLGCEKCYKGLTGAGVLLLTKASENDGPGTYDLVLVEEGRGRQTTTQSLMSQATVGEEDALTLQPILSLLLH